MIIPMKTHTEPFPTSIKACEDLLKRTHSMPNRKFNWDAYEVPVDHTVHIEVDGLIT